MDELASRLEDFEIDPEKVREVKERCAELEWPLLEEYDFRHDLKNLPLPIELRPEAKIRDYQERRDEHTALLLIINDNNHNYNYNNNRSVRSRVCSVITVRDLVSSSSRADRARPSLASSRRVL